MFGKHSLVCIIGQNQTKTLLKDSSYMQKTQYTWIPYVAMFLFVFPLNTLLVYGFYKTSRPFTVITKLFILLSALDACYSAGLAYQSVVASDHISLPCNMVFTSMALLLGVWLYGFLVLCDISFLRTLSIRRPLHQTSAVHVAYTVIAQGLLSFLFGAAVTLIALEVQSMALFNICLLVSMSLQILVCCFILVTSISSFRALQRSHGPSVNGDKNGTAVELRNRNKARAVKTLVIITGYYCLSTCPAIFLNSNGLKILVEDWGIGVLLALTCLQVSNTGVNSMILILRTKKLREFYGIKWCCF